MTDFLLYGLFGRYLTTDYAVQHHPIVIFIVIGSVIALIAILASLFRNKHYLTGIITILVYIVLVGIIPPVVVLGVVFVLGYVMPAFLDAASSGTSSDDYWEKRERQEKALEKTFPEHIIADFGPECRYLHLLHRHEYSAEYSDGKGNVYTAGDDGNIREDSTGDSGSFRAY